MGYRQWEIDFDQLSEVQRAGLEYWRDLSRRPGISIPLISDFDLLELPAAILPTTHVADVLDGGENFRFRFWGSGFRTYMGYDATGQSTADLKPDEIAEPVRNAFQGVVRSKQPLVVVSEFERSIAHKPVGFQRILRMPLAADDGSVGQIVSLVELLMDRHEAQKLITEIEDGEGAD